ncbi:MAG: hypothetical protein ACREPM_24690, partial [Gemmatimonadaceae bacterium]
MTVICSLTPSGPPRRATVACCALAAIALAACHSARPETAPSAAVASSAERADSASPEVSTRRTTRFYASRPYGSEEQFNPVSTFVNEGLDEFRTTPARGLLTRPWRSDVENVLRTLAHPDRTLRAFGYRNWLRDEVFPLSLKGSGGGQWFPNYTLHLWGSGMTYARLVEWFEQHGDDDHPRLAAGISTYAFHFLNEVTENSGLTVDNEDALTDLAVFDAASILLWNHDWVQRVFSGSVEMTDWPGQP